MILSILLSKLSAAPCTARNLRLTSLGGQLIKQGETLSSLAHQSHCHDGSSAVATLVTLEIRSTLKGGKGGFGSMLRAQGGKMSSNRNGEENNDSCRDLNGRRLSTVKQARQLALYLSNEAERQKEISEAQKKKYAKLEKMLGRKPKGESDFVEAAQKLHEAGGSLEEGGEDDDNDNNRGEGSSQYPSKGPRNVEAATEEYKGKKRERIDDTEYIEQSREIVDNVRSAVASAMMKKKKKAKMATSTETAKAPTAQSSTSAQAV